MAVIDYGHLVWLGLLVADPRGLDGRELQVDSELATKALDRGMEGVRRSSGPTAAPRADPGVDPLAVLDAAAGAACAIRPGEPTLAELFLEAVGRGRGR